MARRTKKKEETLPQTSGFPSDLEAVIKRKRSEEYVRLYTNNIEIKFTGWDMRLVLHEITDNPDGQAIMEERAGIVMSLPQAKTLASELVRAIKTFEDRFGEIHLPALAPPLDQKSEQE